MAYLTSLLAKEGHDFRTARHHYGLTQRQAGGKFTSKEASALIDQLTGVAPAEREVAAVTATPIEEGDVRSELLRGMPAELMAAELERRGWSVHSPT